MFLYHVICDMSLSSDFLIRIQRDTISICSRLFHATQMQSEMNLVIDHVGPHIFTIHVFGNFTEGKEKITSDLNIWSVG